MTEPNAAILALSLALLLPQGMSAQVASKIEAGALVTSTDGEVPASTMRVSPGLRLDLPLINIAANGSAWLQGQQWQIANGTLSASIFSPSYLGVRGEFIANASRAFFDQAYGKDQLDGQLRLHKSWKQRGGIWVGGGAARPWRIAVVSHVDVAGAGAWTRLGGTMLSGTFTNFFFTKVAPRDDSSSTSASCQTTEQPVTLGHQNAGLAVAPTAPVEACRRYSRFSDLEGSFHWEHSFLEISAQTGYRFGSSYDVTADSRRWAAASATIWLTEQVAAVLGGGRVPTDPARGLPARNYANVGVMLAYAPVPRNTVPVSLPRLTTVKGFEVKPAAQGMQRILLRVGGVESVELMGDFSDWGALQMIRRGRDLWELVLPLTPGMHQINMRVDGGPWATPPGMPVARDGFSGEVGLLMIP